MEPIALLGWARLDDVSPDHGEADLAEALGESIGAFEMWTVHQRNLLDGPSLQENLARTLADPMVAPRALALLQG